MRFPSRKCHLGRGERRNDDGPRMTQALQAPLLVLRRVLHTSSQSTERRLFLMALSLIEVAGLAEHYKTREVIEACDPLRYVPWY